MQGNELAKPIVLDACLYRSSALGGQLKCMHSLPPGGCSQGEEPDASSDVQEHLNHIVSYILSAQFAMEELGLHAKM